MLEKKKLSMVLFLVSTLLVAGFSFEPINAKTSPSGNNHYKASGSLANTTVSKAAYSAPKNVFMWKVTSKNKGNKKVYVLGSVHIANNNIYPLDKRIETAFNSSKNLVLEADTSKLDKNLYQSLILKYGINAGGKTLESLLPAQLYKDLSSTYKSYGVDIAAYNMFKPWVPYSELTATLEQKSGYAQQVGIDSYFLNKAEKAKKKVMELESIDFQYNMMSNFSDALQAALLKDTLYTTTESFKAQIDSMYNFWKKGDAQSLEKLTFTNTNNKEMKEFYDKMFYIRNVGMANKIASYFKDNDTYFVIAGAGHMVGKKGVIELLRSKGYTVTQQ